MTDKIYIFARNFADAIAAAKERGLAEGQWIYIVSPPIITGCRNIKYIKTTLAFRHDEAALIEDTLRINNAEEVK